MDPHSRNTTDAKPPKKGFGCLVNTLIALVILIIAIAGGVWQLIMHTSLPLRFVTNLIEKDNADSNLKITGTSGSLSSGFKAEKGAPLEFGNLVADSDHLVIRTTTPPASDYQKRVEITLLPKLHASIRKPIRIDALLGEKDETAIFDIKAFDEAVHFVHSGDGPQQLRATAANLADFLDAPLPNQFHLDAEIADHTLTVRAGSFLLGAKPFEIQPNTATDSGDKPEAAVLLAHHRDGTTEIRYEIHAAETETGNQSFTPVLTSTPAMAPEDLMTLLFHDRESSTLTPSQRENLRKHMTWFSFPE